MRAGLMIGIICGLFVAIMGVRQYVQPPPVPAFSSLHHLSGATTFALVLSDGNGRDTGIQFRISGYDKPIFFPSYQTNYAQLKALLLRGEDVHVQLLGGAQVEIWVRETGAAVNLWQMVYSGQPIVSYGEVVAGEQRNNRLGLILGSLFGVASLVLFVLLVRRWRDWR
jgi:hypothetical protein